MHTNVHSIKGCKAQYYGNYTVQVLPPVDIDQLILLHIEILTYNSKQQFTNTNCINTIMQMFKRYAQKFGPCPGIHSVYDEE